MEEKTYQFTRQASYLQLGVVTASSKDEARKMIINGEYDDIYDMTLLDEDDTTIEIEEE